MKERFIIVPVMGHYEIKDTYNSTIICSGDTYREAVEELEELSEQF